MACSSCCSVNFMPVSSNQNKPISSLLTSKLSSSYSQVPFSSLNFNSKLSPVHLHISKTAPNSFVLVSGLKAEPLKVMISGAPASGKGTQCELITKKFLLLWTSSKSMDSKDYDLVHIAAGDLLRAEVAAGTENGRRAKEYMEKGQLVPDEIVVTMVKERLLQPDSQEKGWLLDGYPRSSSQTTALKGFGFEPHIFILLEVPEEILVERVVGRRLDPVTGKIYHLKYSPPETEEIAARLTQRFDDTEEKVKLRLLTHNKNVEAVLSMYEDRTVRVDGSLSKEDVFNQIDAALRNVLGQGQAPVGSVAV